MTAQQAVDQHTREPECALQVVLTLIRELPRGYLTEDHLALVRNRQHAIAQRSCPSGNKVEFSGLAHVDIRRAASYDLNRI